mgnify:FL=1
MPPMGPHGSTDFKKPKNAKKTFGKILQYMGKSKMLLLVVFITLVLSTVCSIGASYCLKPILDGVAESIKTATFATEGKHILIVNLAKLTALYIGAAIFTFIQSKIMVKIAYSTANLIRKDLFDHMQTLPLSYFDSRTHGEIMSSFTNDVDNIQTMLEQSMVQLVSSAFTFAGIVAVMIKLSPAMFGIALIFLLIMIFSVTKIGKQSRKYFRLQQENLGVMNGNIEENIEGLKVIKVFNHEEQSNIEFGKTNDDFRKAATNANFFSGIMGPCSTGINNASYASVALIGGILALTGKLSIGTFFTFLSYSKQFTQPINQIANQMNTVFSALAGAERVFKIMDIEKEIDNGTVTLSEEKTAEGKKWFWLDGNKKIPVEGRVVFENVDFGYVPEKQVLKNINLYANPGQKIAFVGSTGAGKTTITNLINRFYDIQDGTITYDGIDIKRIKKDDLRRSLAIVLQDTHMFTGTIMDNIRYGRLDATDEECIEAAKLASAHSFIRRLPESYNTVITGDGGNLSQGQRQLLAIARAAVADPPVMILDEATSSIDTRTELHIEHGMDRLMIGRTVFVIAHRLSTVRNSNAIMVLENGEIIERGSHSDLLELKGRYYELCTGKAKLS